MRAWLAALAVLSLALALMLTRYAGYDAYVVTSGSMEPTVAVGSLIVAEAVPPDAVRIGDVITYAVPDRVVTHRVRGIEQRDGRVVFTTRGDANAVDDPWLAEPDGDVGALRLAVPLLGYVVADAQAWWRPLAIALLLWLVLDTANVRMRRYVLRRPVAHTAGS